MQRLEEHNVAKFDHLCSVLDVASCWGGPDKRDTNDTFQNTMLSWELPMERANVVYDIVLAFLRKMPMCDVLEGYEA